MIQDLVWERSSTKELTKDEALAVLKDLYGQDVEIIEG